jgi:hypothetical protein
MKKTINYVFIPLMFIGVSALKQEPTLLAKANSLVLDSTYNFLIQELFLIEEDDQSGRGKSQFFLEKYGVESKEYKGLWESINRKDSINLIKISSILDKHGWLGEDVLGYQASRVIFLVIQHSDLPNMIKYLPMLREAVKRKKANPAHLAYLEDRIAMLTGKKQIYGSQIVFNTKMNKYFVCPIASPDSLDKRRSAVGLGTMAEYVKEWGLIWDIKKHKKEMPETEKMLRENQEH